MTPFCTLDSVSRYFIIGLLCVMFMSMRMLFTWPFPSMMIYIVSLIFTLVYAVKFRTNIRYLSKATFVSLCLFILVYLYEILFIRELNVIPLLAGFIVIFNTSVLLMSGKEVRTSLLYCCDFTLKIIIGVSLVGWILFLLGVPLPHFYSETDAYYKHTVYYLFVLNGTPDEQLVPRFAGMFLEPGHLGTTSCFLLYLNKFNMKKIGNIILLASVIFSLSLAAYGLLVGGVMLYFLFNSKKGILYIIPVIIVFVGIWIMSVTFHGGDNILYQKIFARLEFVDGEMTGSNRTTKVFDRMYDRFVQSDDVYLGMGRETYEKNTSTNLVNGCAGIKRYVYTRGIVGTMMMLLFLVSLLYANYSPLGLGFFILFVVANMIRDYPQKELWLYLYCVALPFFKYYGKNNILFSKHKNDEVLVPLKMTVYGKE